MYLLNNLNSGKHKEQINIYIYNKVADYCTTLKYFLCSFCSFFQNEKIPSIFQVIAPQNQGSACDSYGESFFKMRITPIFTHFPTPPRICELETSYLDSMFLIKFRNFWP